jgi:AraC family transcriptional regulator
MQTLRNLLENVLNEVENRVKEDINADFLADRLGFSSIHLQRLFKFAFKQPIGAYIRSRKLAASLDNLLNTGSKIIDIALEYGFEHEETYIRAFKREFAVTPGIFRRTRQIVKITPPINLFGANFSENGIMFEPEIVMVPQFHIVGRKYRISNNDLINMAAETGTHFWFNERSMINNITEPNVYIGLTKTADIGTEYTWYLPSIQVKTLRNIPKGFDSYTFNSSFCTKFRYIGREHFFEHRKKFFGITDLFFEKINTDSYDGDIYQMEWFAPIKKVIND